MKCCPGRQNTSQVLVEYPRKKVFLAEMHGSCSLLRTGSTQFMSVTTPMNLALCIFRNRPFICCLLGWLLLLFYRHLSLHLCRKVYGWIFKEVPDLKELPLSFMHMCKALIHVTASKWQIITDTVDTDKMPVQLFQSCCNPTIFTSHHWRSINAKAN